jgi:hypothetical protein
MSVSHTLLVLAFLLGGCSSPCGRAIGARHCLPAEVAVGTSFAFEVGISCASDCEERLRCAVAVEGTRILADAIYFCPKPNAACITACGADVASCRVPPLNAGTYDVVLSGNTVGSIVVRSGVSAAPSCRVDLRSARM